MKNVTVLGINDNHNATACLLRNGKIVACLSEERLNRIKNAGGFPILAVKKIIEMTGISGEEIDRVVFGLKTLPSDLTIIQKNDADRRLRVQILSLMSRYLPSTITSSSFLINTYVNLSYYARLYKERSDYEKYFKELGISHDKIAHCEHHFAHAAAYYLRPPTFNKRALIFTNDGEGDGLCATISLADGENIERLVSIPVIHSIGGLYSRVTWYMGFKPWEHEYKIMGLAPYVNPVHGEKVYNRIFKDMYSIDPSNPLVFKNNKGLWGNALLNHLNNILSKVRFDSIAYGIQKLTEEVLTQWISNACEYYDIHDIVLSGGTFMNIKADKCIMELPTVDNLFVFPSGGDESTAIGAAVKGYLDCCREYGEKPELESPGPLYLGPSYENEMEEFTKTIDRSKYEVSHYDGIEEIVGEILSRGEIIARYNERMEWGARALGNRSILADPRNIDVVREINKLVKSRDFWMPFTPSILMERVEDYLINPKNIISPYMALAFDTTEKRKEIIAAIHPADFTARPQMLDREWNPKYHKVISIFQDITGVGGILNTSLNIHGFPMDCTPQDAFWTLENSGLKYMAMGDYLIHKK